MKNYIKELRSKFKKYEIDGYVIPKNDDYFTEYSKLNRLEVISNFSGSAGLAIILKNKNYLFTDGRYTIQSKIESGKNFKIYGFEKLINCSLFKNLTLGIDPKLFTNTQIKNYFLKHNKIKYVEKNLIDEIKKQKEHASIPFFSLDKNIVGESVNSKLNKITKYLKKNKSDYIFISAPENVAWTLNVRGGDGPNSPIPNSRLIVSKSKNILLISDLKKCRVLLKNKVRVIGSGRTDSGVHAIGQSANFICKKLEDEKKFLNSLNYFLSKKDITINSLKRKKMNFHSRFDAKKRIYKYIIVNKGSSLVLDKNRAWLVKKKLNLKSMKKAVKLYLGTHNFNAFRSSSCGAKSPVRTIEKSSVTKKGNKILITFSSRSFLQQQVRSMVGCLKVIGEGKWNINKLKRLFNSKKRSHCAPPAPSSGLYLYKVTY